MEIREKMRKDRMNKGRSEAFLDMSMKEEEVAQLRAIINEGNLSEHLSQLKYLSISAKAMNQFVYLAEPVLQLALHTKCK